MSGEDFLYRKDTYTLIFSAFSSIISQLEQENHYLKGCNLKLTEQIKALQEALQGKCVFYY